MAKHIEKTVPDHIAARVYGGLPEEFEERRALLKKQAFWCYPASVIVLALWLIGRFWLKVEYSYQDCIFVGIFAALVTIPALSVVLLKLPGGVAVEMRPDSQDGQ
jgi:hypothetical protein